MPTRALREALGAIEEALGRPDQLDEADRAALDELRELLDAALARGGPGTDARGYEAASGVRRALERFEARHPKLAEALGRLADALAAMGL